MLGFGKYYPLLYYKPALMFNANLAKENHLMQNMLTSFWEETFGRES